MVEEVEPTFDLNDPIPLKDGGWMQKISSLILYEVIEGVSTLLLSSHALMSMSVRTETKRENDSGVSPFL